MPKPNLISFTYKEIVELLIRRQGLREGIWGLYVKFGLGATNLGPAQDQLTPTALVGVAEIGLRRFDVESNLAVDAAKVAPQSETPSTKRRVLHGPK